MGQRRAEGRGALCRLLPRPVLIETEEGERFIHSAFLCQSGVPIEALGLLRPLHFESEAEE